MVRPKGSHAIVYTLPDVYTPLQGRDFRGRLRMVGHMFWFAIREDYRLRYAMKARLDRKTRYLYEYQLRQSKDARMMLVEYVLNGLPKIR